MLQVILASDVVYEAESAAALAEALARHLEEAEGRALLCCPVRDQVQGLLYCRHSSCCNGSHTGNLQLDCVVIYLPYSLSCSIQTKLFTQEKKSSFENISADPRTVDVLCTITERVYLQRRIMTMITTCIKLPDQYAPNAAAAFASIGPARLVTNYCLAASRQLQS